MTKIVIDIPDEDYKFIKDLQFYTSGRRSGRTIERNVINGIKNSTPYEERPTGHWIKVTDCYCWHWECENCRRRPSRTNTGYDDLSNFCPNCGADMRKEEEE